MRTVNALPSALCQVARGAGKAWGAPAAPACEHWGVARRGTAGASARWLQRRPEPSCKASTRSSPKGFRVTYTVLKAAVPSTAPA